MASLGTARVTGMCLVGTEAELVTVEARFDAVERQRPEVVLSGLPDPVVRESKNRWVSALASQRLGVPPGRLVVHLAPAGLRKAGEALDLPLALGAAAACGHLRARTLEGHLFLGELGLDGRLQDVVGGLAAADAARRAGLGTIVAPPETAREAACLPDVCVRVAESLGEVVGWLAAGRALPRAEPPTDEARPAGADGPSLDEVRGQAAGKRALAVAAAGAHGLLFAGPPGSGKSLLARGLLRLLGPPTLAERMDITRIHAALGRWRGGLARDRPFRAPHHTASTAGLVGGGNPIRPGEITLAHGGVLFLDELPEFPRAALESLRQPLERGTVELARAGRRTTLPAAFRLVAAMNPCPCGYRGHPLRPCRCSPHEVRRYRRRLSGPLLDRIELRLELVPPDAGELGRAPAPADEEQALRIAVERARTAARSRQGELPNAALASGALDRWAPLSVRARALLVRVAERHALSARAVQGLRRVARTLADLEPCAEVRGRHLTEALALRAPLFDERPAGA